MADIRTFAPYIYDIKLRANDLEFILPCGQHNWIDVSVLENNSKWNVGLFVQLALDFVLIILFLIIAFFEILAKKVSMNIAFVFDDFYEEKTNIKMDLKVMKKIVFSFSKFVPFFLEILGNLKI